MSNTNDSDAKDNQMEESTAKAATDPQAPAKEQAEPGKLPSPGFGFDGNGEFFVVKVHVKYGSTFIRGLLRDADDWLAAYTMQQRVEMEKRKLLKPNDNKFLGRFNLFKGKS
jgi:hypothetical protein